MPIAKLALRLNDIQSETADLFLLVSKLTDLQSLDGDYSPVAARSLQGGGLQFPLPPNQWQIETEAAFAATMSALQSWLTLRVVGPTDAQSLALIREPATEAARQVCQAQRSRKIQGLSNVSLLGMLMTLCTGTVIIIVNLCLDSIVVWFGRRSRMTRSHHGHSWIRDHVLQIQRIAYESQTSHQWDNTDGEVPYVIGGEPLLSRLWSGSAFRYAALSKAESSLYGLSREVSASGLTKLPQPEEPIQPDNSNASRAPR
jgi:hypothetical protein